MGKNRGLAAMLVALCRGRGDAASFRSGYFRNISAVSGALFDRLVLSGMWIAAGDPSTAAWNSAGGVGSESADCGSAAVFDLGLVSSALFEIRGQGLPQPFLRAVWIRVLCAAIILFGIARNLPLHPFDLLAPGARAAP